MRIPEELKGLIGLKCCEARTGYASSLVLGFGNKIYDNKRRIHSFYGEWELRTYSCSWRLNNKDDILCGIYDDEEENDEILTSIISLRLIDIICLSDSDIILVFENEYKIILVSQSRDADCFSIRTPNEKYFKFNPTDKWVIEEEDKEPEGLNEKEKLIDELSEKCFNRWSKITPKYNGDAHCKNCVFFRPLRGEFYFWDYGICSNEKSQHDGKLVEVDSGCSKISETLGRENL